MSERQEDFHNAVFRETKQTFSLQSYKEGQQALAHLINQATTTVNIYSQSLCPAIFNSQTVIDACEQFSLKNHRTHINILIQETRPVTQVSHRILSLAHKHISSVSFKKLNIDIPTRSDDYVCIDRSAYWQLPNAQGYESICNYADARRTAMLLAHFNDAWERSSIDSELRELVI